MWGVYSNVWCAYIPFVESSFNYGIVVNQLFLRSKLFVWPASSTWSWTRCLSLLPFLYTSCLWCVSLLAVLGQMPSNDRCNKSWFPVPEAFLASFYVPIVPFAPACCKDFTALFANSHTFFCLFPIYDHCSLIYTRW